MQSDATGVYITCNKLPQAFHNKTLEQLQKAIGDYPVVAVSHQPIFIAPPSTWTNLLVDLPRSQASIYRQVLIGCKEATTKYVFILEDDCLYSEAHFKFRPKPGHWGYNMNAWNVFTWERKFFHQKPNGRRNLNGLICERDLLIEHLEERFKLWPDDSKVDINIFGEPGKYDNQLGTTSYPSEYFYPNPPNIVFSHEANLQFQGLGKRKKVGQIRAIEVPYWGNISDIIELYK